MWPTHGLHMVLRELMCLARIAKPRAEFWANQDEERAQDSPGHDSWLKLALASWCFIHGSLTIGFHHTTHVSFWLSFKATPRLQEGVTPKRPRPYHLPTSDATSEQGEKASTPAQMQAKGGWGKTCFSRPPIQFNQVKP